MRVSPQNQTGHSATQMTQLGIVARQAPLFTDASPIKKVKRGAQVMHQVIFTMAHVSS
jgi:hypothetical protein